MSKKDFTFELPKPEVVESWLGRDSDKEKLLDEMWLFNTTPWVNHDSKVSKIKFVDLGKDDHPPIQIEMVAIHMNGHEPILKRFLFDSVIITAFHGTANHYTFDFILDDKRVHITDNPKSFAYTMEDLNKRFIDKLEREIKGYNYRIANLNDIIEKINELT